MSKQLTPKQKAELEQLQQLSQQVGILQQNKMSLRAALQEAESALKEIENLPDEEEIYKLAGTIMYKTTVGKTKAKLQQNKELYEVQLTKLDNQIKSSEEKMKELDTKLRKELGIA